MEVVGGLRARSPTVDVHHQLHHRLILHMPPMRKFAQYVVNGLSSARRSTKVNAIADLSSSSLLYSTNAELMQDGVTRVRASGALSHPARK